MLVQLAGDLRPGSDRLVVHRLRVGGDDVEAGACPARWLHSPARLVAAEHDATALGPVELGVLHERRVGLVGVHRGRLEAERDEEVDHRPRVVGLEGAPDGGGRCRCSLMVSVWPVAVSAVLDVSALLDEPVRRAATGHLPELAGQVALVGVAGRRRDLGEAALPAGQLGDHAVEAEAAAQLLGRQTDLGTISVRSWRGLSSDVAGHVLDPAAARGWPRPAARPGPPRRARATARRRRRPERSHCCTSSSRRSASVPRRTPGRAARRAARPSTS